MQLFGYIRFFIRQRQILVLLPLSFWLIALVNLLLAAVLAAFGLTAMPVLQLPPPLLLPYSRAILLALLFVAELAMISKSTGDALSAGYLLHLRRFGLGRLEIATLGLIQALPAYISAGFAASALSRFMPTGAADLSAASAGSLIGWLFCLALAATSLPHLARLANKQQRSLKPTLTRSGDNGKRSRRSLRLWKQQDSALLLRDLAITPRIQLTIGLPLSLLLALLPHLFGLLLAREQSADGTSLPFVVLSYFSYLFALLVVLSTSYEVLNQAVAAYHLRRYRLLPSRLWRLQARRLIACAAVMAVLHLLAAVGMHAPLAAITLDLLAALLALLATLGSSSLYIWFLTRNVKLGIVSEMIAFTLAMTLVPSLLVGLTSWRYLRK